VISSPGTHNPFHVNRLKEDYNNNIIWLKAFFDGGTSWNKERQTENQDGENILSMHVLDDYSGYVIETVLKEISETSCNELLLSSTTLFSDTRM
jgi:hypothetical protein